jgi:hypothetical protein
MIKRLSFLFRLLGPLLLAHAAQADDLPVIGQAAVTTPTRSEEQRDLGLELLWLPVESRTSLTDYVGRNLPGAALDTEGRLLLRGGRAGDTALELDGLRVGRLSLPVGMVERLDLATAGYGAEWSDVLGGVVSVTTKAADNRLHVDADLFDERAELVETRTFTGTVSLPLVKDKLFLLVSTHDELSGTPALRDPEGITSDTPPLSSRTLGGGLKLTWVPHPSHRLELLALLDDVRRDNLPVLGLELEAQPTFSDQQLTLALRWSGRLGERFSAHGQVAYQSLRSEESPVLCRTLPTCDFVPPTIHDSARPIQTGNWLRHAVERDTEWQVAESVEARVKDGPRVRERLRYSARLRLAHLAYRSSVPGDTLTEFNQQSPEAQTTYFSNDPRVQPARFGWFSTADSWWTSVHTLESETRLWDRLWIVPGLGLTWSGVGAQSFDARAAALTPGLSMVWDAFADGRAMVHASAHQRAAGNLEDLARFTQPSAVNRRCRWNSDTMKFDKGCIWSGGDSANTVGLPCAVDNAGPDGAPCNQWLRLARAWELATGGAYQLSSGVRAGVDVVYRKPHDLPAVSETNRIWNASGTDVTGYRSGRAESIHDYSPHPELAERYLGVTAWVRRQKGALQFLASYTRSRHDGMFLGADGVYRTTNGASPDDHTHVFRALSSYDLAGYASFGLLYSFETGAPYSLFYSPVTVHAPAMTGTNPGTNVNDPGDDRPTRTPSEHRMNLQVRVRGRRLIRADLDLYVDLINVLASRQTVTDEASFNNVTVGPERWVRAGLEYRY